jgi:Pyruvate/2-oxoacid:ferredoxin oxidoreductase delta subunit
MPLSWRWGQHADLSLLSSLPDVAVAKDDTVVVNGHFMTGHAGIFAGGDCIGGARTMTTATGHGKRAAQEIDAYLKGEAWEHPPVPPVVTFDMLHLPDYMDAARTAQPEQPVAARTDFSEVVAGLSAPQAWREAGRCLSCGNCYECDNCFAACPEQAITRRGPGRGYDVSLDLCSGCAACAEQCPCHAIDMVAEPQNQPTVEGSLGEPLAPRPFQGQGMRGGGMMSTETTQASNAPTGTAVSSPTDGAATAANGTTTTIDGNTAVAHVAYRLNEVCAIFPITPSSPMAELADVWASQGVTNLWGAVPVVQEMQAEGGAAGCVHGAVQSGALTTTFTASQGLMLMIPNMYKIAGELTSTVFHVAARALAAGASSIFGDHQDIMAVRQTGFALLGAANVQEGHDLAVIAQAATLRARVPFIHFTDGFRTSHEYNTLSILPDATIRAMIDDDLVYAHRARALSPDHPFIRGTWQNPRYVFSDP